MMGRRVSATSAPRRPTKATSPMFRILKFAAVAVPVISRFLKSPRGQKLMASAKARVNGGNKAAGNGRTQRPHR